MKMVDHSWYRQVETGMVDPEQYLVGIVHGEVPGAWSIAGTGIALIVIIAGVRVMFPAGGGDIPGRFFFQELRLRKRGGEICSSLRPLEGEGKEVKDSVVLGPMTTHLVKGDSRRGPT